MSDMQPHRPAIAILGVVVVTLALSPTHGAAAADPLGSAVVPAATSVGAVGSPVAGSVEALPPGSHAGSAGALDAGSGLAVDAIGLGGGSAGGPVPPCAGPARN